MVMRHRTALECDVHLVPIDPVAGCQYCLRFLEDYPDVDQLTQAQRLEELERWLTAEPSVPIELLYRRIEALVGRRISMHELDDPDLLLRRAQRPRRNTDWDDWW